MFNLIRKDIVMQKKTLALLMLGLCAYVLVGISSIWIGFVFSVVIVVNAFSLDEKSNIHMFLNSLPYTRKEIVSAKYVVAVLITIMVALALFVGNLIFHGEVTGWKSQLVMISMTLAAASFILPFSYKFKSQYLFIASVVAMGVYFLVISFFIPNLNDQIRGVVNTILSTQQAVFYGGITLSVLVMYALSWLLSIRIYEKKVL